MTTSTEPKLEGRRIIGVRNMTKAEMKRWDWEGGWPPAVVVEIEGGFRLIPSRDEEGNGPGALFLEDGKGNEYCVA